MITLVIAMAALLLLTNLGMNRLATDYITSRLQHDGESIIAALHKDVQGNWQLDENRTGAVYGRVHSGHYYHLSGRDVSLQSRSLWDHNITLHPLQPGETNREIQSGFGNQVWLIWEQGFNKDGENFTLWIAEDIQPFQQSKLYYMIGAVVLIIGTLTILLVVQQWQLRRGFRQLDIVRTAIVDLRNGNDAAMNIPLPDEVEPLAEEVERLLIQLQKQVRRSRNSLGNLVHELKRPLQRLRLLADPLDSDRQKVLAEILENIQWLIERELKRARIVGVSSPGRHMIPAEVIPDLLDVFKKIYPAVQITASWPDDATLPHDRDDILELLGNLLDNACQYGNGIVNLRFEAGNDHWLIDIADNGPGIPDAMIKEITYRGARLDESSPGGGLGLAICKDIVTSWSGTLTFGADEFLGGLRVTVTLPKSTPDPHDMETST